MHYTNNIQELCESMVAPDGSRLRSTNISFGLVIAMYIPDSFNFDTVFFLVYRA